ncbi:hypothetical protein FHU13_003799 [Methylobacterium sp. R2-1]|nr:hypothetical protein [Methylobacterium sp. R2-1]
MAKGTAWIDALALHRDGSLAFSAGRRVVARDAKGHESIFEAPSTARGLAFAPKGYRLVVAHYNGVSLWYPNLDAAPEVISWKGSHIDVSWSVNRPRFPGGRWVWVRRPRLAPRPEQSSAPQPRREARCRSVRAIGGC